LPNMPHWFFFTAVFCGILSVLSCVLLLLELSRFRRSVRRRLFARQLAALAAVDILQASTLVLYVLVSYGHLTVDLTDQTALCWVVSIPWYASRTASMTLEAHIAAGSAAAWFRRADMIVLLQRFLPWAAPVGAIVGVVGMTTSLLRSNKNVCHWQLSTNFAYAMLLVYQLACFLLSFLCYMATVLRTCRSTGKAQRTMLRLLTAYWLCFAVSYAPRFACDVLGVREGTRIDIAATAAECLNGFFNVATYFFQKHSSWRKLHAKQRSAALLTRSTSTLGAMDAVSFHVLFDVADHDVVEILRNADEARQQSEAEIVDAQLARFRVNGQRMISDGHATEQQVAEWFALAAPGGSAQSVSWGSSAGPETRSRGSGQSALWSSVTQPEGGGSGPLPHDGCCQGTISSSGRG